MAYDISRDIRLMTVTAVFSDREGNVVSRYTFVINRAVPAGKRMFAGGIQAAIVDFHDHNRDKRLFDHVISFE